MRCCRFLVAGFLAAATRVAGHPICTDDTPPVVDQALSYCPEQQAGVCCTDLDEEALEIIVQEAGAISEECESYYKQVVCGRCHSFSGHLYARLWPPLPFLDGLTMKKDFCDELVDACTGQGTLEFPTYAEGSGTLTYCEKHAGTQADDIYWSYPFIEEPVFDPGLTLAFPDIPDEDKPAQTLTLKQSPDGSMFWLVGQVGKIISVDAGDSGASAATVIDLGPHNTPSLDVDPTGVFHVAAEEGLLDVAFDPLFNAGSGDAFYLSYTVKYDTENRPRNRLSKFLYYPGDPAATRASEEILLTTIQKISPIHASGWLDFKPSDFANPGPVGSAHDIYWSSGDGGKKVDQLNRGQDPTNMLGAIIRISVSATDPGYTIPAGNVESGGNPDIKEEICAYGFRNPFRCGFDKVTDKLYCGDVGHFSVEEIDLIECGNNYGWKILEGDRCHTELEDVDCNDYSEPASRSGFTSPYFQYCHNDYDSSEAIEEVNLAGVDVCGDRQLTGRCVIGGYVYRGELFEDLLYGAYVFGDNETKNIHYLLEADGGTITVGNIISDGSIAVIGFAQTNNGEMMVIDLSYNIYHLPCGDLCEPSCLDKSENLPTFQSEGCFVEVASDRALPTQAPGCSNGQDAMTAEICASYCGTIPGMEYMGLHAGSECSCGGSGADFGRHGTATTCDMPCTATPEETCGGVDAVEIFSLGEPVATPAPTASSGTPMPIPAGTPVPTPSAGTPVPFPVGTPVPTPSAGTPVPFPVGTPVPTPSATPTPIDQTTGYTYIDCFQDQKDDRIMTLGLKANVMNAEKCFGVCSSSPFFATQYGRECWCGSDDYDKHGTSTACTVDCNGTPGDEICGGSFAASVYSNDEFDPSATPSPVVPPGTPAPLEPLVFTSLGCFQDQRDDRIMIKGGQGNNMDSLVCAHTCVDSPFFATQYGSECWCGPTADYDKHGPSDGCTVDCAGNPDEICGGSYAASVYGF